MYRVDFREPTFAWRTRQAMRWVRTGVEKPGLRFAVYAVAAVLVFQAVECARLHAAFAAVARIEAERDALAARVRHIKETTEPQRRREAALAAALRVRRSNATLASAIARLGNVLGPEMVLATLRGREDGLDIEGRSSTFSDIRRVLERLDQNSSNAPEALTLDVHQDDPGARYVSFHVGYARSGSRAQR